VPYAFLDRFDTVAVGNQHDLVIGLQGCVFLRQDQLVVPIDTDDPGIVGELE